MPITILFGESPPYNAVRSDAASSPCANVGWRFFPIASKVISPSLQLYCGMRELWEAGRQRGPIVSAGTSSIPTGSYIANSGYISGVTDNGDGTISLHAVDASGTAVDWSSGITGFPPDALPPAMKIAIFPDDSPDATSMGDANLGLAYFIQSTASDYAVVNDDGKFIYNGLALSDYIGFAFHIIRGESSGIQQGYPWFQRQPPRPNDPEYDYGVVTTLSGGATTGSDSTHIEDSGRTTTSDPNLLIPNYYVNRWSIKIGSEYKKVTAQAVVSGHARFTTEAFTATVLGAEYDLISATTTSITDPRDASNHDFKCPKNWPQDAMDDDGFYREMMCLCGTIWRRVKITIVDAMAPAPTLLFSGNDVYGNPITIPPSNYWLIDEDSWWREEFALQLEYCIGRGGPFWHQANANYPMFSGVHSAPWQPLTNWNNVYTDQGSASHEARNDTIVNVAKNVQTVDFTLDSSDIATIQVFDNLDAGFGPEAENKPFEDAFLNARMPMSIRGLQIFYRDIFGGAEWVKAGVDYSGASVIPVLTIARWGEIYAPGNSRRATITAVTAGVATINLAMPIATTLQGAYTSLTCDFTILDATDDNGATDVGTATATTLTGNNYAFSDDPDTGDVGKTVIIFFGDTRFRERGFQHLYGRTGFIPDQDDGGDDVVPPTSDFPGFYITTPISANYAEYGELGDLNQIGVSFIPGESARYLADNLLDPTGAFSTWDDALYQGLPNVTSQSSFFRWEGAQLTGLVEKSGTMPGGGWIQDTKQLWELSASPLITYTFTSTGTSSTVTSSAWATDGRFTTGLRLEVCLPIIEVSPDGGMTWVARPSTAYDASTQIFTTIDFGFSTGGKMGRFSEPGYIGGRGALASPMATKRLILTAADKTVAKVKIIANDKDRMFWAGTVGFTIDATTKYQIEVIPPGTVMQYRPDHAENINGFVTPEFAVQDNRGQKWHVGKETAWRENLPTIVRDFGLFRRGDSAIYSDFWNERYESINCLRWVLREMDWSSRSPSNFLSNTEEDNTNTGAYDLFSAGPNAPTYGADTDDRSALHVMNTSIALYNAFPPTESDGTPPFMFWDNSVGNEFKVSREYAYGIATAATSQLASSITLYICSDVVESGKPPFDVTIGFDHNVAEFYDYGEGLTLSAFKEYITLGPDTSIDRRAATPFPSTALTLPANPPNLCYGGVSPGDPFYPSGLAPGYNAYAVGFYINRKAAIEKFDVAGGLTYAD